VLQRPVLKNPGTQAPTAPRPVPQGPLPVAAQRAPFCAGAFLDGLPGRAPPEAGSWCECFGGCFGIESAEQSAARTAYRQLLALLERLPDTVQGNEALQDSLDRLQGAFGAFQLARRPAAGETALLETLLGFSRAARALERRLVDDYETRWKPANLPRQRLFG